MTLHITPITEKLLGQSFSVMFPVELPESANQSTNLPFRELPYYSWYLDNSNSKQCRAARKESEFTFSCWPLELTGAKLQMPTPFLCSPFC